jgi:hypothetical protein
MAASIPHHGFTQLSLRQFELCLLPTASPKPTALAEPNRPPASTRWRRLERALAEAAARRAERDRHRSIARRKLPAATVLNRRYGDGKSTGSSISEHPADFTALHRLPRSTAGIIFLQSVTTYCTTRSSRIEHSVNILCWTGWGRGTLRGRKLSAVALAFILCACADPHP